MKHINSIILTLLTALLALPSYAQDFTYEGLTYEVLDQEAKTCKTKMGNPYEDEPGNNVEGELVIPTTVFNGDNEYTVVEIGDDSFKSLTNLTSVTLPETIERIGYRAFERCTGLASINFPNSITSIEENAFNTCTSLLDVSLSENITNLGTGVFANCSSLNRIVLPKTLTYISEAAFNSCENLKTIEFNEYLEEIGNGAFSNCGVETLEFPESLTQIDDWAFANSANLVSVVLPANLTKLGSCAFDQCRKLKTIIFPQSLTTIDQGVFRWCDSLESVELPDNVTSLTGVFEACPSLKSVKLPKNLKYLGNLTFRGCKSLTSIDFPDGLETIEGSFADCTGLSIVRLPESLTTLEGEAFAYCGDLKSVTLPVSLQVLSNGAFGADDIESIYYSASKPLEASEETFNDWSFQNTILNMPNATLAEIEAVVPWNKFGHINAKDTYKVPVLENGSEIEYNGIVYVVIDSDQHYVKTRDGNEDDSTAGNSVEGDLVIPSNFIIDNNEYYVVEIGHHGFSSLDLLNSVTIEEGITKISYSAFINCENLKSVSLPETLTELESHVFSSCKSLESIELPSGLTEFGSDLMSNCTSLSSVKLPENLSVLPGATFWDCKSLTSIEFPAAVTRIGNDAFWGCSGLASIVWPESLQYVDEGAFAGTGFVSVEFPEGVLSIERRVLKYCANLESITLPASLTYLADEAFDENNEKLRTVTYNAEFPIESGDHVFTPYEYFKEGVLYTPNALLANVLPYSPWNHFGKIVAKDETYLMPLEEGENFEYEGIWYTVIDTEAKTCRTKTGDPIAESVVPGNTCDGELIIPASVTHGSETYSVVEIGEVGFWGNHMTTVSIGDNVTNIGWSAFRDCTEMTELNLPNSLISTEDDSFQRCLGLTSVVLPESLKTLGGATFSYCENLETVTIPAGLTELGGDSFIDCNKITEVNYLAETPLETGSGFETAVYENAVLNTPNASLADIRATEPWRNFNRIVAKDGSYGFGLAAGEDFEYEGIIYTVIDAEAKTVKTKDGHYNSETDSSIPGNGVDGELTIPSIVSDGTNDYTVVSIGERAFCETTLTSIIIPAGVTEIGSLAFYHCSYLTSINVPEGVTSIEEKTFEGCYSLTSINIPAGVTSIGFSTFKACTSLTSISLPLSLTSIESYAFQECPGLTSINIPDGVTSIGNGAFMSCLNLTSINLPEGVTSIEDNTFAGCSGLTSINIPDGVISIGGDAFSGCASLSSITIPEGVTSIGDRAFVFCSSLSSIKIPDSVTSIGMRAFDSCSKLTSINIPEGVDFIGACAFADCSSLYSISIPAGVTTIESSTFVGCNLIAEITYFAESPIHVSGGDAFEEDTYNSATLKTPNALLSEVMETFPWGKFKHIVAKDGSYGFGLAAGEDFEYEGIWYTVLDADSKTCQTKAGGIDSETGELISGNNCQGDITVPSKVSDGTNDYTVKTIGNYSFYHCEELTSIILPDDVNSIGYSAFEGCSNLTSINIPDSVTTIQRNTFYGCSNLISITLPDGVTSIGDYAFGSCSSLTSTNLPDGITSIETGTFEACSSLLSINIPEGVTSIGYCAFNNCSKLTSIIIPEGVITIEDLAFCYCSGLSSIKIPNSVTSIGHDVFLGCSNLTSVDIPESVTSIGSDAFSLCFKIEEITYNATTPIEAPEDVWEPTTYNTAILNTPNATLADVQATTPWNKFLRINASDGSVAPAGVGEDFEYQGIKYTVISVDAKTCCTKQGDYAYGEYSSGNLISGELVIPSTVSDGVNDYSVIEIGSYGFAGCSISSVSLPESVTLIRTRAFLDCKDMVTVSLPESLTAIESYSFHGCLSLSMISLPESLNTIGIAAFEGCSSLTNLFLPESVTSVGVNAFLSCEGLTSVILPATFPTCDQGVFGNCKNITEVTYIAENPVSSVEDLFDVSTYETATLNMPNATLASVQATSPWNKFSHIVAKDGSIKPGLAAGEDFGYDGIWYTVLDADAKTVKTKDGSWNDEPYIPGNLCVGDRIIPEIVSDGINDYNVVSLGEKSFIRNTDLLSVKLPESLTSMGEGVFYGCSSLASIEIPDGITVIPGSAFDSCSSLASVKFPINLTTIGGLAFANCSALTSLDFPETLTTIEGFQAFANCTSLTSVAFPESMTYIGESAFLQCPLISIHIPANIETIDGSAFAGCFDVTDVTYDATNLLELDSDLFEDSVYANATLYTPNATLDAVLATTPWNKFLRITACDGSIVPFASEITLSQSSAELKVGETVTLEATVIPDNATNKTVTWSSDNEEVATVDSNGKVTATSLGETTITATCGPVSATCVVTVVPTPVESVTLSNTSLNLTEGESATLTAIIAPADATDQTVTWTSSDTSVATVSEFGEVVAVKEGTASIIATSSNGKTASCTVTVASNIIPVTNISISDTELILTEGDTATLTATVTPADATDLTVTWTSSDASVVTVSENGEVVAVNAGNAIITASSSNGMTATCTVTVDARIIDASDLTLSLSSAELKVGETVNLEATVIPEDATDKTVTWSSSDSSVAAVSDDGVVLAVKVGSATITATTSNGKTATCIVTVVRNGDDFVYNGMTYTVIDEEAKTVRTKVNWYQYAENLPEDMFDDTLVIPATVSDGADDYTVVEIGAHTFDNCEPLTAISLPETLTTIDAYAFASCRNLTSVSLPEGLEDLGTWAFGYCESLTSISIPYTVNIFGTEIFRACSSLSEVQFAGSIPITYGMFMDCTSLESFDFSHVVGSIGEYGFNGCTSLKSVELSDDNLITEIKEHAFGSCNQLSTLRLPESLLEIRENAFWGCDLISLTLPASLTSIGHAAFDRNQKIAEVTYNATEPIPAFEDIFDTETADIYATATLNMPNATLTSVQATSPWNKFRHIIAKDGSIGFVADGDDFEYEGIWYTVIDVESKTVRTREGKYDSETSAWGTGNVVEGDIIIPTIVSDGSVEYSVVEIGSHAFAKCAALTSLSLPETVTSIGPNAFDGCSAMAYINLPESVSSIGRFAFVDCSALTSIVIPESLTELGQDIFWGCSSLVSVTLPESLTSIGGSAFYECSSLTSINFPSSLVSIGDGAFYQCSSLKILDFPESLASIGQASFFQCASLESIKIPASVTSIGTYAFFDWNMNAEITYLAIDPIVVDEEIFTDATYRNSILYTPNATLASVQATTPWNKFLRINAADGSVAPVGEGDDFEYEGIKYTVLDLEARTVETKAGHHSDVAPNPLPEGMKKTGHLGVTGYTVPGNYCEGSIVIPSIVSDGQNDYTVVAIGEDGFHNCENLISVTFPETLEVIKHTSFEDTGLREVNFPNSLKEIEHSAFISCDSLKNLIFPESLKKIGELAFYGCNNIENVSFPAGIEEIGYAVFDSCYNVKTVTYNAELPIRIDGVFVEEVYASAILEMPNASLADIVATDGWNLFRHIIAKDGSIGFVADGDDFEYEGIWYTVIDADAKTCKTREGQYDRDTGNLVEGDIVIPAVVSDGSVEYSVVEIGYQSFAKCAGLTSLSLPETVTSIGAGAFYGCSDLTTINIPFGVTSIASGVFLDCSRLTSIYIPDGVTSIGENAFHGCSDLTSIYLGDRVNSIGRDAFRECTSLTSINIPEGVTSIGKYAFLNCSSLTSMNIPESVTSIGEYAFSGCTSLELINIPDGMTTIETGVFLNCSSLKSMNIPESVTSIGESAFQGCLRLTSISITKGLKSIGDNAFKYCPSLTSLVWKGQTPLQDGVVEAIGNPNLLVYVDDVRYAPEWLDHNIVAAGVCDNLVLTPGYAFTPLTAFTAEHSEITKSFTQQTPIGGCAGWETMVIPFEPESITVADGRTLVPFSVFTDIDTQCPFWLYEADAAGEWKEASAIHQGVPYILSMPNNDEYAEQYCVDGEVTFMTDKRTLIAPETCAPYATTWNTGREFRSLWLPLTEAAEAANAMGLNVGISSLYGDDGALLAPGSAFHADVLPKPLEAYVTRIDGRRAMPVLGDQSFVTMIGKEDGLGIAVDLGAIILSSDRDRTVDVFTMDGMAIRHARVKAGVKYRIENLTRGIYIVAGRKITVK